MARRYIDYSSYLVNTANNIVNNYKLIIAQHYLQMTDCTTTCCSVSIKIFPLLFGSFLPFLESRCQNSKQQNFSLNKCMVFWCNFIIINPYIPLFPIASVDANFPLANPFWLHPPLSELAQLYQSQAKNRGEGGPIIDSTHTYTCTYILHTHAHVYGEAHYTMEKFSLEQIFYINIKPFKRKFHCVYFGCMMSMIIYIIDQGCTYTYNHKFCLHW